MILPTRQLAAADRQTALRILLFYLVEIRHRQPTPIAGCTADAAAPSGPGWRSPRNGVSSAASRISRQSGAMTASASLLTFDAGRSFAERHASDLGPAGNPQ